MQITPIQNKIYNNNLAFGRRLRRDEEADYQKTVESGFEASGVKQRIAITHGSVFPAVGRDAFIGSPYGEGAKEYIKFLKLNGFNGNQLGPNGVLYNGEISPYNASALNENPLFIDLHMLTTNAYGKILSQETYQKITETINNNDKNYTFADQIEAKLTYYVGLTESYKNFKTNLSKGQPDAIKLNKEFDEFKETKGKQTEEEGLYRLLTTFHKEEDYTKWTDKLDQNLMTEIRNGNPDAKKRYNLLTKKYNKAIEQYQFEQFLVTKQIKENKEYRKDLGFQYFSDLLIGCSKMDAWRYKEAFLDGYAIGSFEHGDTPYQTWGVPVLNPRMLFIGEKGLNIGGKFLEEKINHALENCENMRIDHALGLVDPFVYEEKTVKYDENGKQIKSEVHGNFMSQITDEEGNKLDDYYNYPRILTRLVLKEIGKKKNIEGQPLNKTDVVWENICCDPDMFKKIYYEEQKLPKLIQLDGNKGAGADDAKENWFLIGSHDSIPVMNMFKASYARGHEAWDPVHLAGYLFQDPAKSEEKEQFMKEISDMVDGVEKTGSELEKADKARIKAKFAELFTKEKIQVSFADILGINDKNVVYNKGGESNKVFWRERISSDFIDKYYENLSSDNPTALNIPEVLNLAVQAKINMQVSRSQNKDETRAKLNEEYKPLLEKLEHYAQVLKEKEN